MGVGFCASGFLGVGFWATSFREAATFGAPECTESSFSTSLALGAGFLVSFPEAAASFGASVSAGSFFFTSDVGIATSFREAATFGAPECTESSFSTSLVLDAGFLVSCFRDAAATFGAPESTESSFSTFLGVGF